jgi:hypothetical protein
MTWGELKRKMELLGVKDDAELYYLPAPESKDWLEIDSASIQHHCDDEFAATDVNGKPVPVGSGLLFPQ